MLFRLLCCFAFVCAVVASHDARAQGQANCAGAIGKLMSRDAEKLATRYQRVAKRMERERSPRLVAESCRIARALDPMLAEQIAALKQSNCAKDPEVGSMVADIVRGHEDDLASLRKSTRSDCR